MNKQNKGFFITFEGGEGVGKTTLINRIYETLLQKNETAVKTREPGGTPLGSEIRRLLLYQEEYSVSKQSELFLYLADRAQHVQEIILPALIQGKIVLCDRFNDSTLAYQGVARALDMTKLRSLCCAATDGLIPDLTFFLDLDPQLGLKRAQQKNIHDRIESESLAFHHKVREAFLSLAREEPNRFYVIDASQAVDAVYAVAFEKIEKLLCLKP